MEIGEPVAIPQFSQNDEEEKCEYCKKKKHPLAKKPGNSIGNGTKLRKNIIANLEDHSWYTGSFSLQAHHLICSEAMDDDNWPNWCSDFGYDIDRKENGVMLPFQMTLACQLHAPLHRGGHAAGVAEGVAYPAKIINDLKEIGEKIKAGNFCDNPQSLIEKLNRYSQYVLNKIDKFSWTITRDGRDYKTGGIGCAGVVSIDEKPHQVCPLQRQHHHVKKGSPTALSPRTSPLEIGH